MSLSPKIFLHSVIGVEVENPLLFEHWIRHYLSIGIERDAFLLVFHCRDRAAKSQVDTFEQILRQFRVKARVHKMTGRFDTYRKHLHSLHMRQTYARSIDWIVAADLDEFHRVSNYPKLIDRLERWGYYALQGELVDRVAATGRPAPIRRTPDIHRQFPLMSSVTQTVLRAVTQKILAHKMCVLPFEGGNHTIWRTRESRIDSRIFIPGYLPVDHYKWSDTVLHRLAARKAELTAVGAEWAQESDRALSFLGSRQKFPRVSLWASFLRSWRRFRFLREPRRLSQALLRGWPRFAGRPRTTDPSNWNLRDETTRLMPGVPEKLLTLLKSRLAWHHQVCLHGSNCLVETLIGQCRRLTVVEYVPLLQQRLRKLAKYGNLRVIPAVVDEGGRYARAAAKEGPFDVVVIGGVDRFHCAQAALQSIKPDGVIILLESHQPRYQRIVQWLESRGFFHDTPDLSNVRHAKVFFLRQNTLGLKPTDENTEVRYESTQDSVLPTQQARV